MTGQQPLFVAADKPCSACNGTGASGPLYEQRRCLSCGGTGLEKDRPRPDQDALPKGF